MSLSLLISHPQAHTLIGLIAPYVCTSLKTAMNFERALTGKTYDFSLEVACYGYSKIWQNAPAYILQFAKKKYVMAYPIPIELLKEKFNSVRADPNLPSTSAKAKLCYFLKSVMSDRDLFHKYILGDQSNLCCDYRSNFDDRVRAWVNDMYDEDRELPEDHELYPYRRAPDATDEMFLSAMTISWCNILHRISFLLGQDLRNDRSILHTFEDTHDERTERLAAALRDNLRVRLEGDPDVSRDYRKYGIGTVKDVIREAREVYFFAVNGISLYENDEDEKMEKFTKWIERRAPQTLFKRWLKYASKNL